MISGSFWGSVSTCCHRLRRSVNDHQQPPPNASDVSAHCRRFLVRGWCCAKSFGSEILAQAWMRSQQSGVLPAEGIMRLGWWVTVKYVKNHSRVFVMWIYNDSSFQSMRAKNLPTTYDNLWTLWTDWYFANKTWISRSHFQNVSKSISTSDSGLQEPNMTSQPLDFPGTSYQLSQGACLLLFNVDHMLMFFLCLLSNFTFQSILGNLAILIILIVDPTRTPISWHPARTAATLEGRQEVDCTRYESGSFRRGSPGSTSGVGSYWAAGPRLLRWQSWNC